MRISFNRFRQRLAPYLERASEHTGIRLAIIVGLVLGLTALFPRGLIETREYPEGSVWNEDDLIAAFAFPVQRDPAIVEKEQRDAERSTPRSFDRVDSVGVQVRDSVRLMLRALAAFVDLQLSGTGQSRRGDEALRSRADSLERSRARVGPFPALTASEWRTLFRMRAGERSVSDPFRSISGTMLRLVDDVIRRGYLDRDKGQLITDRIAISTGTTTGVEDVMPVRQFLDFREAPAWLRDRAQLVYGESAEHSSLIVSLLYPLLRPNVLYNSGRTAIAIQAAIDRVERSDGMVKENERIVSRHERVTAGIKNRIDSYNRARLERAGDNNRILQWIGKIGHAIALLLPLGVYLFMFRKRIFYDNSRLLLIALLIVFEGAVATITFSSALPDAGKYLILVPAAAMLLAIIFDSRVAFYSIVTISFLVGALRGNDYSVILSSLLAGTLAVYTVRDIKHRTQIFRSLAFVFLGYAFAIGFDGLQRTTPLSTVGTELLYASANAILSPILTFGMLAFFERVFGITTDLTLLELSDFNRPLLRDLSSRAPGTFHHSIVMGSLAEAAAGAIGANSILARVGAYYHDIGKMLEPEYFVENQLGSGNVHDQMDARSSARKIIDHVTRGIELARESGLPQRVIDFIPAHHGTTMVSYFLEKARKEGIEVDPALFRYAGPRPHTRETAIVMLADTIEAAARAIEEPTIEKIEKLIDSVVTKRLSEGELDDCDLTFRDLATVRRSFLTTLSGIHHSRIKYPTEQEAEAARKSAERTATLLNLPPTADALSKRIKKLDSF